MTNRNALPGARVRPLAKRTADSAKPEAKRYVVWDDKLKGFGLRVEPTGRKTFIARYRAGGGRSGVLRQATVGRFGTVTAEEARKAARKLLGAASTGDGRAWPKPARKKASAEQDTGIVIPATLQEAPQRCTKRPELGVQQPLYRVIGRNAPSADSCAAASIISSHEF